MTLFPCPEGVTVSGEDCKGILQPYQSDNENLQQSKCLNTLLARKGEDEDEEGDSFHPCCCLSEHITHEEAEEKEARHERCS